MRTMSVTCLILPAVMHLSRGHLSSWLRSRIGERRLNDGAGCAKQQTAHGRSGAAARANVHPGCKVQTLTHRWLSRLPTEAEVLSTPHRSGNQTGILRGTQEQVLTEWQAWSYMHLTWFSSQFTKGEYALDWAKNQVFDIGNDETTIESTHGGWTDLARINYRLLWCHFCRDEALTVIRNSLKGQVMEETLQRVRAFQRAVESSTDEASAATKAAKS